MKKFQSIDQLLEAWANETITPEEMVEEMLSVIAIAEEGGAIFLDKGGAYREAEPEMGSSEHAVAADGGFGDVDIFSSLVSILLTIRSRKISN